MAALLYHSKHSDISPFDAAIVRVAKTGPVRIVSPYIGVGYLERIVGLAGDWRLVSDIEEWLKSMSIRARPRAWAFIREHIARIHHAPAVHAKAVISQTLAMMGSANLTATGILGRTELGILIDNRHQVEELNSWFEDLWSSTASPLIDETSAFVQWLDKEAARAPSRQQRRSLSAEGKRVRAKLLNLVQTEAPVLQGPQLDIGVVAHQIIADEQRHYDSIGHAVNSAIEYLAPKGRFRLRDVVALAKAGYADAQIREIYLLLVQHCANHVRSVFVEDTINRLILSGDCFVQSTAEILPRALAPYDTFLETVFESLSLAEPRPAPSEAALEAKTGFVGWRQQILISELIDCGLLEIKDAPGELPAYRLSGEAIWEGRYKLFLNAKLAWHQRKASPERALPRIEDHEEGDTEPQLEGLTPILEDDELGGDDAPANLHIEALQNAHASIEADQLKRIDSAIAYLIEQLFAGRVFAGNSLKAVVAAIFMDPGFGYRVGKPFLEDMLTNKTGRWPVAFRTTQQKGQHRLAIDPTLSWETFRDYPQAQEACKKVLS